ncbi:hypothetical protein BH11MYX1_BH11MYX1_18670 [soil metagenome]
MASPDNSVPPRPSNVPATVRWDPKEPGFEWVDGELDAESRRHGAFRSWTREGVLHGQVHYDHGRVHGKNINLHPDGTIASEADWVSGVIMDSVFHRSAQPSTEPFAQAHPNVWSVRYYTRDGKTNYTIRYFARDATECGPDGQPLPPRPAAVSLDARWFSDIERWVDGEIERGTNLQLGRWRWWTKEGVLRHEELRDAAGDVRTIATFRADGSVEKRTSKDAHGGEQRELFGETGKLSLRMRTDAQHRQTYTGVWLPDGSLVEETTRVFEADELISVVEKSERGVRRFEAKRQGPALACTLFQADGKALAATGLIARPESPPPDGRGVTTLVGTWRIFDDRGTLRRDVDTTTFAIGHEVTGRGLAAALGAALYRNDEQSFASPAQLQGIDREPWADLAGARGVDIARFPRLARGLVADDPLVREYALRAIRNEVLADGLVYPASAHVVPYLAKLLAHPQLERTHVLGLLYELALASLSEAVGARRAGGDTSAVRATADALDASWPAVFSQFATCTLEDRRRIFELAKVAPAAKPAILEIARKDSDATLRALATRCFVELPTFTAVDAAPLLADKDALVRATTAIAIGLHRGPDAPREAVHGLDDALRNWREYAKRYAELPFAESHVLAQIALAAGAIRTPDARSLTHQLCTVIDEVDGRSAIVFARGLLELAFGPAGGSHDRPYAKRFLEILEVLARSKAFWSQEAAACDVLESWRLPPNRIAILALATEIHGAGDPEAAMHAKLTR